MNWSRIVPYAIRCFLENKRPVIRSDGKFVRDFLYVKDAAAAYLTLGEHLAEDESLSGEAFNFSIGQRFTVLDIVQMVLKLMGRTDLEPVIQNNASSEIREQYLDRTKAREQLGWQPQYGIEDALRETIAWYQPELEEF